MTNTNKWEELRTWLQTEYEKYDGKQGPSKVVIERIYLKMHQIETEACNRSLTEAGY